MLQERQAYGDMVHLHLHLPVWQECLDALLGLRGGAGSAQLDVLRAVKEQQATVYEFVVKPFR